MTTPLIQVSDLTIGWEDMVLQKGATFQVERGDSVDGVVQAGRGY